jgi:hypothetical protein
MTGSGGPNQPMAFQFSPNEVALLRTGLEMLEDTFGREEAEELGEVQALLAKLERQEAAERARS